MKSSKGLMAVVALFALSTFTVVTPSAYLNRAKAAAEKAKAAAAQAQAAYTQAQDAVNQAKGVYGQGKTMYGKYMGTPSAAQQAQEEAMMEEMNAEARRQGLGTN